MQMRIAWPLAVVFLWVCSPVTAQDDVPWWRQMFGDGKATKEVVVEPIAEPIKEGQGMPDSIEEAEEAPVLDVPLGQPVETTLILPSVGFCGLGRP